METEMTGKRKVINIEEDISYDWKNLKELEKRTLDCRVALVLRSKVWSKWKKNERRRKNKLIKIIEEKNEKVTKVGKPVRNVSKIIPFQDSTYSFWSSTVTSSMFSDCSIVIWNCKIDSRSYSK